MNEKAKRGADHIENLISKMTIEEKAGQLNLPPLMTGATENLQLAREGLVGGIVLAYTSLAGSEQRMAYTESIRILQEAAVRESRLGIPILFGRDVIHGHRTVFPVPLGQAASFDAELTEKAAAIAASEARRDGVHWVFAPMADISRDARWGRVVEGFGEDTLLTTDFTKAAVRGFQSNGVAACVKHFVGYGAAEGGRDYNTVEISETTLRKIYLPPFKAAVDEGVMTVMTAFHDIGGEPLTASHKLITQLLKDELGFKGFVASDWDAVGQLVRQGLAADGKQAAKLAFNAGVDMDMVSSCFVEYLPALLKSGEVSSERVDDALRRVLKVKLALGLFDSQFTEAASYIRIPKEYLAAAKECAVASCVLLKNEDGLLPLPKSKITIALVGPYADDRRNQLGCWTLDGREEDTVTLAQGLKDMNPRLNLILPPPGSEEAAARGADYVIVAIGENWDLSGEARSSANITIPSGHIELLQRIYQANRKTIVILSAGRPLVLEELFDNSASLLLAWQGGTMAGAALADLIFGDAQPAGKLPMTFPRSASQLPLYYNYRMSGRDIDDYYGKSAFPSYRDFPGSPYFPFGYGLSYTTFEYGELFVKMDAGTVHASAVVKNSGLNPGTETVQCYLAAHGGGFANPVRELIGYRKVYLAAGQQETVSFTYEPAPGVYGGCVYIGSDCVNTRGKGFAKGN
jgi:beta-glucosidase